MNMSMNLSDTSCPDWLPASIDYAVISGSVARRTNQANSDRDIYGFVTPPKELVFPHLAGYVHGYGPAPEVFSVWNEHRVDNTDYALSSLPRYVNLLVNGNPDVLSQLYVPEELVIVSSEAGDHLRSKRAMFHSVGQVKALCYLSKNNVKDMKGVFNKRYGYHALRTAKDALQFAQTGEMVFVEDADLLAIRLDEMPADAVYAAIDATLLAVDEALTKSSAPEEVDSEEGRRVLFECLEIKFGNLSLFC